MNRIKGLVVLCIALLALPVLAEQDVLGSTTEQRKFTPDADKTKALQQKINAAIERSEALSNQSIVIKMSSSFQALAITSEGLNCSGKGNVDFWMRTCEDFARTGRAIGAGALILAARVPDGPIQAALISSAHQLTALEAGTQGDVYYWMHRCGEIVHQVNDATDQMISLSHQLSDVWVHVHTALRSLVAVMTSTSTQGNGDAGYWIRVSHDIVLLGRSCGRSLEHFAQTLPDPLYTILTTYTTQLKNMSSKGEGDVDYWYERAKTLSAQIDNIGISILAVSKRT